MKFQNSLVYFSYHQLIQNNIHLGDSVKNRNWFEENFCFMDGVFHNHFVLSLNITIQSIRKSLFLVEKNVSKRLKIILSIQNPLLVSRVQSECYYLVKYGCYFINTRWVGGILTNFKTLSLTIFPFLVRLNKLPRRFLRKKIFLKWQKLLCLMNGMRGARILPSFAFGSDLKRNPWLFREAFLLLIPSSGLVDSDSPQSSFVTYPLSANDDSFRSVLFFFLILKNSFLVGRLRRKSKFLFFVNSSLQFLKKNSNLFHYNFFSFIVLFFFYKKLNKAFFKKCLKKRTKKFKVKRKVHIIKKKKI